MFAVIKESPIHAVESEVTPIGPIGKGLNDVLVAVLESDSNCDREKDWLHCHACIPTNEVILVVSVLTSFNYWCHSCICSWISRIAAAVLVPHCEVLPDIHEETL